MPNSTPPSTSAPVVETRGIDVVPESERTAKPSDLFWPWFAANISVFGISYGSFVLWFGLSFWQGALVTALGVTFSFFLCGLIAVAGKRGSAPTMVLSRAAFGVEGQKVPGIVSWLTSIGGETFLSIMAVLATTTVIRELGGDPGTGTKITATVIVAGLIVAASVLGYHTIMKLQSVLTWITGAVTVLYMALSIPRIDWTAVQATPAGSTGSVVGALVMVMTGFGLGWINIAADWSRYQRRDTPDSAIIFWNTFGGAIAPAILVVFGLLLAASDEALAEAIADDPIGALAVVLPTWVLVPFLITAVLALVSGAVLGIYSSGLTLLTLGINIPRPAAAAIDGVLLTAGTIWVVFFAQSFLGPFQSFLITLGVPLASWAGILIADIYTRTQDYDEPSLYSAEGRYGAVDWTSIGILAVSSVIGWGLVTNLFAEEAAWNNWQGYFLSLVGEHWADANLGVLVALVLSFVAALFARRGRIRRQEGIAA
ncbi:cytosine permease [Corynebacterium ureicelerivorans]|uniref:purine-cytosine permease family protein n=1 Tax=Corynebacterium ureicelerivorans TaxID=401472 RepID=UPI00264C8B31|nr:cytosine permease [Corynebacterium ureicelerivorans]MDN8606015.1 cytosine permease [Corynebacterium ureicelerivorans]